MNVAPPAPEEMNALLRLLDDETPAVREQVAQRLALCGGDISEWLATQSRVLKQTEKKLLTKILSPARREALTHEWIAPTGGAAVLAEDWDTFEALLRILSDFLHDGITLRQSLGDALDLLAEEAGNDGISTESELRAFLFEGTRFTGNQIDYYDPRNSDLAWSISEGRSNPLGLCLIFILVAKRMEMEVEGVNFPGHFMCRYFEEGYPIIVDCFDHGRMHLQSTLLENPELDKRHRDQLRAIVDPGTILLRVLSNLHQSLRRAGRDEDAQLVDELKQTLA
jgi:hypothetical protein